MHSLYSTFGLNTAALHPEITVWNGSPTSLTFKNLTAFLLSTLHLPKNAKTQRKMAFVEQFSLILQPLDPPQAQYHRNLRRQPCPGSVEDVAIEMVDKQTSI